jgi:hypothetical protein
MKTQQPDSRKRSHARLDDRVAPDQIYPRLGAPFKRRWLFAYALVMYAMSIAAVRGFANVGTETLFMLSSSLMGLVVGMSAPRACRQVAHPLLFCVLTTCLSACTWAKLTGATTAKVLEAYNTWPGAGSLLSCMFGPAFSSLGVLLYKQRNTFRMNWAAAIIIASLLSVFVSMVSSALLVRYALMPGSYPIPATASAIPSILPVRPALQKIEEAHIVFTAFVSLMLWPSIFKRVRLLLLPASSHAALTVPGSSGVKSLAGIDEEAFLNGLAGSSFTGAAICFLFFNFPPVRAALFWVLAARI